MTEVEENRMKFKEAQLKLRDSGWYRNTLHVPYEMLTVTYNGEPIFMLNKNLLDQQLCWENLEAIKEVHWLKIMFFDLIMETNNVNELRQLALDIEQCEYELQRLYKFSLDSRYHRFWDQPKCTCPSMDNDDGYPIWCYIKDSKCPLHGTET